MNRRRTVIAAGALTAVAVLAIIVVLTVDPPTGGPEASSPEDAVRAVCHAGHVLLEGTTFQGDLRFVDWQPKGAPPLGAGWTALVKEHGELYEVLVCKHDHFAHFPMPQ